MDSQIKTKEVKILANHQPKLAKIEDYWSEEQKKKIVNLLRGYHDVFARDYKDLKGIVQEMGEMKITFLPNANLVKKRLYKLAHKYKYILKNEIDNI